MSEVQRLHHENLRLSDEVKRLVKTERELYQVQEHLDGQMRGYRQLYEIGKKFNATFDLATIAQLAVEFVLYELNFERCLMLSRTTGSTSFAIVAMDGYYDDSERDDIARLVLRAGSSALVPFYAGLERVLCTSDSYSGELRSLRRVFGMDEYVVLPLGGEPRSPLGLLVAGNTAERAQYQRRVVQDGEAMLGLANLAGQTSTAINNANFYQALEQERQSLEEKVRDRTRDLEESLDHQTATSDVLKVISRSTFDLQPVLDTVVETAARLCDADQAAIFRIDGKLIRLGSNFGFPAEYEAFHKMRGAFPIKLDAINVGQRTARERRVVHIYDVAAVPGYPDFAITLGKQRTALGVPLLRESVAIGVIVLARQRVEPFTDRQIELVSSFADQAVIAMENARLISEQREALAARRTEFTSCMVRAGGVLQSRRLARLSRSSAAP